MAGTKGSPSTDPAGAQPVPPDAVRVWRGFRLPTLTPADFVKLLGSTFIPASAQLQRLYGLTAYLPTVLPTDKPDNVPDEIALVFYKSQKAYNDTKKIVAGRVYSELHKTVFAFPASQSGFPTLLGPSINLGVPYYLFAGSVDWQKGISRVFVGDLPDGVTPHKFAQFQKFFQDLQRRQRPGLDGAIFCISSNWVLYWEHWVARSFVRRDHISRLSKLGRQIVFQEFVAQKVKTALEDHYRGLTKIQAKSFNVLFPRQDDLAGRAPRVSGDGTGRPRCSTGPLLSRC